MGEGRAKGQEIKRWNFLVSKMQFSLVSHHFAHNRHANPERLRPAGRFSKISSFGLRLLISGRTMIACMSRPINLALSGCRCLVAQILTPRWKGRALGIVRWLTLLVTEWPPTTYLSSYERSVHSSLILYGSIKDKIHVNFHGNKYALFRALQRIQNYTTL